MPVIETHFPHITETQRRQLAGLAALYEDWNAKINVISRKDMEHFYVHHVLHSLAIAKYIAFVPGSRVLDVGTGGGFPGIPLSIFFPETEFVLVDSIGKKIRVVEEVAKASGVTNITAVHGRAEDIRGEFDFVVTRAVAPMDTLLDWTARKISRTHQNAIPNGLIALKGGDLVEEIRRLRVQFPHLHVTVKNISDWFSEPFYETKQVIHAFNPMGFSAGL